MKFKKVLSTLMAILMLTSVLPSVAGAATTLTDSHQHSFVVYEPGVGPTCTTAGYHYMYCECGQSIRIQDNALGHAMQESSHIAASCVDAGSATRVCSRCGYTESQILPALGHNWGPEEIGKQPTCTENGFIHVTCLRCRLQGTYPIEALGHNWTDWYQVKAPTTTQEGLEKRHCQRCLIEETRPIPPLDAGGDCQAALHVDGYYDPAVSAFTPGMAYKFFFDFVNDSDEILINPTVTWKAGIYSGAQSLPGEFGCGTIIGMSIPITAALNGDEKMSVSVSAICKDHGTMFSDSWAVSVPIVDDGCSAALNISVSYPLKSSYEPDSDVGFSVYVTNVSNEPISNVFISESQYGQTIASGLSFSGVPGESLGPYPYTLKIPITGTHVDLEFRADGICDPHNTTVSSVATKTLYIEEEDPWTTDISISPVMYVDNAPKDPKGFQVNETIVFALKITNNTPMDFQYYKICDPSFTGYSSSLAVGDTTVGKLSYVVTQDDVDNRGFVSCQSGVEAYFSGDPWSLYAMSNLAVAPLYDPEPTDVGAAVSLSKSVISAPKNGLYYTEDETAYFCLTITNNSEVPITANVYDFDAEGCNNPSVVPVPAQGINSIIVQHKINFGDCSVGQYTNRAVMDYVTEDGSWYFDCFSNKQTVPCGYQNQLTVSKSVACQPQNGSYFTEGEAIIFSVNVKNSGDRALNDVKAFDMMDFSFLDSRSVLNPGESFNCTFTYTVTAADVAYGRVTNYAYAISSNNTYGLSNPSVAYTAEPGDDEIPTYTPAHYGEDHCVICLTAFSADRSEYEMTTCSQHGATEAAARDLLSAATDASQRIDAWKHIAELWTTDINELYEEFNTCMNQSGSALMASEQITFFLQVDCMRDFLKLIQDEETAERMTALLLREKAVSMCCELHEAPDARKDSIFAAAAIMNAEPSDTCDMIYQNDADSITYVSVRCKDHAHTAAAAMPEIGLEVEETARVFMNGTRSWSTAMNRALSRYYTPAGADDRSVIVACRNSYTAWLDARETLLGILYPEQTAVVAEVMCAEIMNRTVIIGDDD